MKNVKKHRLWIQLLNSIH